MKNLLLLITLFSVVISCTSDSKELQLSKIKKNDPFKKTIVKSQFFDINTENNTTIFGEKGTKIVISKNAFLDDNDNAINRNIKFELAEALSINDMILSNLTTTSNGKQLETDGMIFINATHKGKNLTINSEVPIYIEIPTNNKKPNMSVYDGIRDENGNMNWINPKKLKNYLIPIDLELLDFLPKGFKNEAIIYLNYYKIKPTKKAIDSLYYNLPFTRKELGKFTEDFITEDAVCGIDPSILKTIKSKRFNNTLISTKEFEERMKYLHKLCSPKFIEFYVNNLKKDLWEIDKMVVDSLIYVPVFETEIKIKKIRAGSIVVDKEIRTEKIIDYKKIDIGTIDPIIYKKGLELLKKFINFKNQKLTNVEFKSIYINELKSFYKTNLKGNIKKSDSLRILAFQKEQNSKIRKEYNQILKQREKILKQSYGFVATEFGWKNIDRGTTPKNWNYQQFDINITNNQKFNQVHVYLIFKEIKSINKLISSDKKSFKINEKAEIPITKNSKIQIVAIAFNNDESYFSSKTIITQKENNSINNLDLKLENLDFKTIRTKLNSLDKFDKSNNIIKDLEFSKIFETEKTLKENLLKKALQCCYQEDDSIKEEE